MAEQKKDHPLQQLLFEKHLSMTWRILLTTLIPVGVLAGGGYLLDMWLQTKPAFLVAGFILAFLCSQWLNIVVFSRLTKKLQK